MPDQSSLYVVYEHQGNVLIPKANCCSEQEAEDVAVVGSAASGRTYRVVHKPTSEVTDKPRYSPDSL